jgi:hypothetical protein
LFWFSTTSIFEEIGADYRVMIPSFPSPPTPEDTVNHLYQTRKSLPYDDCHQAVDSGHTAMSPLPIITLISTSSSSLLLQTRPSFPILFISVKFLCFPSVSFLFLQFLPLFLWFTAPNAINCNKKDKYFWNQTENTNLVVFFFLRKWMELKLEMKTYRQTSERVQTCP